MTDVVSALVDVSGLDPAAVATLGDTVLAGALRRIMDVAPPGGDVVAAFNNYA